MAAEAPTFQEVCAIALAMLAAALHLPSFLLACALLKSCVAFKNDATEILYTHVVKTVPAGSHNNTMNQARHGGRQAGFDRSSKYYICVYSDVVSFIFKSRGVSDRYSH